VSHENNLRIIFLYTAMRASDLKEVITRAIQKLKAINLKVVALITDMGSNFYKLFRLLNIDMEQLYFEIDGNKIFYIFDSSYLIKATRNNLYHHSFAHNNKCTSWKYILEEFYEFYLIKKFNLEQL